MRRAPYSTTHGLWAMALVASLGTSAEAAQPDNAKRFMRGGTFCFNIDDPAAAPGTLTHLKLLTRPGSGRPPYNIAAVNGVIRGTLPAPYLRFVNPVAGTATLAPSNDAGLGDAAVLQISLTGASYGIIKVDIQPPPTNGQAPQIWMQSYSLQLDPVAITGKLYGINTESGPLEGGVAMPSTEHHVVAKINPIACRDF